MEYAKGSNDSNDDDIKAVKDKLAEMPTIRYFDVFKKSDLIRI